VEIFLRDENIWFTQDRIALLFGVQRPAITKHLKNIFESGELQEDSVSSILEHTADDGKKYPTKFYNLDFLGFCGNDAERIWRKPPYCVVRVARFCGRISPLSKRRKAIPQLMTEQQYTQEPLGVILGKSRSSIGSIGEAGGDVPGTEPS
jgi:hypothetical protein